MTTLKETGRLSLGKGSILTFFVDSSKPKDSLDYHYSEVFYDGEPDSDAPDVPPHWHRLHDEHMTVVQGRAEFSMDDKSYVRVPGDPVLVIPRRHVHAIKFFKGEVTKIQERTNPVDVSKLQGIGVPKISHMAGMWCLRPFDLPSSTSLPETLADPFAHCFQEGLKKDDFFSDLLEDGNINMSAAFRAAYAGDTVMVLTGVRPVDEMARLVFGSFFSWWYPRKHEGKLPDAVLVE